MRSATLSWSMHLHRLLSTGSRVSPRGRPTLELPQATLEVDMRYPVVTAPARKLSYQFMAAEAYWILEGNNRVDGVAPWNERIKQFSDDGETFFGAYGPRISSQLDYVVAKLLEDESSRQAGLTIWRENPPATKDVPCTVAMFFSARFPLEATPANERRLHAHVFMRSSDAWLGVPYDVFSFSMVAHLVCCRLNRAKRELGSDWLVSPGTLHLTAASAHLYEENRAAAAELLTGRDYLDQCRTPADLHVFAPTLRQTLKDLRDSKPGDPLRWWEAKP